MLVIGLIGNGKWGQNYIKLASKLGIQILIGDRNNWRALINSNKCKGIVIATPPESHIEIAIEALKNNLPLMIEKPLCLNADDAYKLKSYQNNTPILVNNLHLFSPAYEYIYNSINIYDIDHIKSIGLNKGPYRNYSALFDYGSHDTVMGSFLFKNQNANIDFIERKESVPGEEFNIHLNYSGKMHYITIGNSGPEKIRLFEVFMKNGDVYTYNDILSDKLFFNNEPILIDKISTLENSFKIFVKSLDGYIDNRFDLDLSIKSVEILERCFNSVRS